jgi:tRNA dimethylallyltransferase
MPEKYIICIQGPTASGKSDLAIYLAKHFRTEIISADSRQFFREMNIGTAKPMASDQQNIRHHFVDFLSVNDKFSAWDFEQQAQQVIDKLFSKNKIPILVGGSGLYIDAVIKGFNDVPDSDPVIRKELLHELEVSGLNPLLKKLEQLDPDYYQLVDRSNPRRVCRALEVCIGTGMPFSFFLNKPGYKKQFKAIRIGISYPTGELYHLINKRCDSMLKNGLIDEVRSLISLKQLPALQTIGYSEFFDYIDGICDEETAIEKFKQHSRNFAKKQMSWLRRDKEIQWFVPPDKKEILDYISNCLY